MIKIYFFTVAILLEMLSGALAETPDKARPHAIIPSGILRVGTTGDYSPFTFRDPKTGKLIGFDIDMAYDLAKRLGARVQFVPTTWPTLKQDFESDQFDIAMGGISITLERQKAGLFSTPYLQDGKAAITRCSNSQYYTLKDIDKPTVRVIVNPGGTNEKFVRDHIKQAQIDVWDDNTTIFDRIALGKADVMITDASETRYQQNVHSGVLCAVNPDKPFNSIEKAYWIQREPQLAAFVDQWLSQSKRDGTYDAIYHKWFK